MLKVNIRSAPEIPEADENSNIVAQIIPNEIVEIIAVSDDGEWYQIAPDAGVEEGWVNRDVVRKNFKTDDPGSPCDDLTPSWPRAIIPTQSPLEVSCDGLETFPAHIRLAINDLAADCDEAEILMQDYSELSRTVDSLLDDSRFDACLLSYPDLQAFIAALRGVNSDLAQAIAAQINASGDPCADVQSVAARRAPPSYFGDSRNLTDIPQVLPLVCEPNAGTDIISEAAYNLGQVANASFTGESYNDKLRQMGDDEGCHLMRLVSFTGRLEPTELELLTTLEDTCPAMSLSDAYEWILYAILINADPGQALKAVQDANPAGSLCADPEAFLQPFASVEGGQPICGDSVTVAEIIRDPNSSAWRKRDLLQPVPGRPYYANDTLDVPCPSPTYGDDAEDPTSTPTPTGQPPQGDLAGLSDEFQVSSMAFEVVQQTDETRENRDIYAVLDGTVTPFTTGAHDERYPAISPDGQWIAYISLEADQPKLYIRSTDDPLDRLFPILPDGYVIYPAPMAWYPVQVPETDSYEFIAVTVIPEAEVGTDDPLLEIYFINVYDKDENRKFAENASAPVFDPLGDFAIFNYNDDVGRATIGLRAVQRGDIIPIERISSLIETGENRRCYAPTFSNNGQEIFFVCETDDGNQTLYRFKDTDEVIPLAFQDPLHPINNPLPIPASDDQLVFDDMSIPYRLAYIPETDSYEVIRLEEYGNISQIHWIHK